MRTFVIQIIISLVLGFLATNLFSLIFLRNIEENLEKQANRHRVEMVLDGFLANEEMSSSNDQVWSLQFHADNVEPTSLLVKGEGDLHTITVDYHEGKLSAVFNEDAFRHDPIMKKLFWFGLFEGLLQVIFSVTILLFNLRSWAKSIKAMHWVSNQYAIGNFQATVPETGPKEIKAVIENQHKMAREIRASITKQKLLFASLPHDIRTPLSAIQLTCDMLSEEMKSTPFLLERLAMQVNSLNQVCESSLHLLNVLNRDLVLERKHINLKEILTSVLESLGQSHLVTHSDTDRLIFTDEKLLSIILLNILSNACRYAEKCVQIRYLSYPRCDVIKVRNDGPQIDENLIEKFNNGLISLDGVSKDGFGFGLILVYKTIKYLNGIALLNNTATGAEMVITISTD